MGRVAKFFIYILVYVAVVSVGVAGQTPRLEPSEWAAELGTLEAPLELSLLIEASLRASGVGEEDLPRYSRSVRELLAGLPAYLDSAGSEQPVGEAVLHYLHERLFTRYSEPQTLVDVMLDTGEFNCVSSAVIYMIAARSAGLRVEGVVTPDHAFCRIVEGDGGVDVETTNPYGYNPGEKREFKDAFGQTGFSYVPPGNYRLRDRIGETELIGLILQNRISLLQRRSRIDLTVPMAVDRYAMTRTERTASEMRKEFINYASVLNGEGRYSEALVYLDRVRELWGRHGDYLPITDTLLYNAAVVMSREGEGEEMLTLLDEREALGDVGAEEARRYRQLVGERLIYDASRSRPPLEALVYLEELSGAGLVSPKTYAEYRVVLHGMQAQAIGRDEGDLEALAYIEELDPALRRDGRLTRAREVYAHNAAAAIHNQFVDLYNAGRRDEAEELIRDGLELLPGSSMLKRDLDLLSR